MDFSPLTEEQKQQLQAHIDQQVSEKVAEAQQALRDAQAAQAQDEAGERSTPAQDSEPASDDSITVQLMESMTKAFRGIHELQQQAAAATKPGMLRVSQGSHRPAVFDGSFKPGEDVQQKILIFKARMQAYFGEAGCWEAVETSVPIRVGRVWGRDGSKGIRCMEHPHDSDHIPHTLSTNSRGRQLQ